MAVGFVSASITDPDYVTIMSLLFRSESPMTAENSFSKSIAFSILVFFAIAGFQHFITIKNNEEDAVVNESSVLIVETSNQIHIKSGIEEQEHNDLSFTLAKKKAIVGTIAGSFLSLGLGISRMVNNDKILDFLDLTLISKHRWDPSLAVVMGSGVFVSVISYQFVKGYNKLLSDDKALSTPLIYEVDNVGFSECIPSKSAIDTNLLVGAMIFGLGWGIGGLCPGPAMYEALIGKPEALFLFIPSMALGANLASRAEERWI